LPVQFPDSLIAGWNFFISATGELYLDLLQETGNLDIYRSEMQDGQYLEPVKLGPEINTDYHDWGTSLDVLGRVMIFASKRPGGSGLHDLYISHKNGDGWTPSENLGSNINGANEDGYPSLSPDGLYLFFTTAKAGDLGYNPYWVRADAIDPILGIREKVEDAGCIILRQNHPNPANEKTVIGYSISKPGHCRRAIYNLFGQEIKRLVDEWNVPGDYSVEARVMNLKPGVYFYSLVNEAGMVTKTMIVY
jgi:hypothetical protein